MIIYAEAITPRLQYVVNFLAGEFNTELIRLTHDKDFYLSTEGPKINYSSSRLEGDEFWIQPHGLLLENGIRKQDIKIFLDSDLKVFFPTTGDISFDIFSAIFYLLSRYEEYLPHEKDIYGRFAHQNSIAYREGFLQVPLINQWLRFFKMALTARMPAYSFLNFSRHSFTFLPTYDIDEAFSYLYKKPYRSLGSLTRMVIKGHFGKIRDRSAVLAGGKTDPYDSFAWMDQLHSKFKLDPRYFILVAQKNGEYDKHILPTHPKMQELIRHISSLYKTGIHPSWQSGGDPSLLKVELATLEGISGRKVISSRQHYIRLSLPRTYRRLIDAGIREDFSMGYGSINGFRASIASPFYWYDLEKEESTSLLLYPFCYMEANSFFEQHYTPQQAYEEMKYYYREIKNIDGLYVSIWHNTFLGTDPLFEGWREIYEAFVSEVIGL